MTEPGPAPDAALSTHAAPAGVPSMPTATAVRAGAATHAPIDSRALFAGASEVQIAHGGALYRLRQTALGKLILTK